MIIVNNEKFNDEQFNNGEVVFKKPTIKPDKTQVIELYFEDNRDLTNLFFARQYIKDKAPELDVELVMKYCPYERMDREINDQMFSMKYFAEFIAACDFSSVSILDPHSKVCIDELRKHGIKVEKLWLNRYIMTAISKFKPDFICYPDKGAYDKYTKVLEGINTAYFHGHKKRDYERGGKVVKYELVDAPDLTNKRVLIIDDICCRGETAYCAAEAIKKAGAKQVALYVSHCEKGIMTSKILKEERIKIDGLTDNYVLGYMIDKIYTANTLNVPLQHKNINII